MTETPVVLVEAMRAGPSTGMPTKPEQADLEHVLYTSQGDSNRVVLAPGNAAEAYDQTRTAFRMAYDYQLPAIVLYDQKLSGELRNVDESFFDREPNPNLGETLTEAELAEAAHHASGKFQRFQHDPNERMSPLGRCPVRRVASSSQPGTNTPPRATSRKPRTTVSLRWSGGSVNSTRFATNSTRTSQATRATTASRTLNTAS